MRKFVILFLLVCLFASPVWAEEEATPPLLTMNIILKDSIAFTGIGLELLLGNLGIGGTFTTIFFGVEGVTVFFYEPGVYVHFYLGKPEGSLYLLGDISFWSLGVMAGGQTHTVEDTGILNLNAGVGFNAYFGKRKNVHFSIELGVRYPYIVVAGYIGEAPFFVIPHFQLQFGMGVL